jgi:predicted MPP superfamily phosphohydrolase
VKKTYRIDLAEHRVDIPNLPAGLEGLRIVHFGDLHAPKPIPFLQQVNRMLREAQPDLLVTTGDILDTPHWLSMARRQLPVLLEGLRPPLGFFATLGNHDRSWIIPLLQEFGATVLVNRWQQISRDGAVLNIGGLYYRKYRDYQATCQRFAMTVPQNGPVILLSHLPSAIWPFSKTRVNLVLAGHTHAGQWRFGRLGCLWTHDDLPRRMAGGLHKVESTYLFVTAGLGESGPIPLRFRCPPEVAVLTLHRKDEAN